MPIDHTYAAMIREFNGIERLAQTDSLCLAAQCLKFYSEAIKMSADFVLCKELGPCILKCMVEKKIADPRIKRIYLELHRRQMGAKAAMAVQ